MQVTNYSNFRKHLKTFMDDCIEKKEPVIIQRGEKYESLVLMPMEIYKTVDETDFLLEHKKNASKILDNFNAMKLNAGEILTPQSYEKRYGK
jgi:antitoxin YefM